VTTHPLIELDFDATAFAADWRHCDQVANYVARTVSLDRPDPFLHANLLSTVLNEALEIVFNQHGPEGSFRCAVHRAGRADRIELVIPAGAAERAFYRDGVTAARAHNVAEVYTRSLLADATPPRSIGLLELAVDYAAEIALDESPADGVRLLIDVTLENVAQPTS
jgi:hypothetical protein